MASGMAPRPPCIHEEHRHDYTYPHRYRRSAGPYGPGRDRAGGQDPTLAVVARIARAGSAAADGRRAGGRAGAGRRGDRFHQRRGVRRPASACAARGAGPVIGSTGFEDEDRRPSPPPRGISPSCARATSRWASTCCWHGGARGEGLAAAGVGHRDRRGAPPAQGRRAVGHRADAWRSRRAGRGVALEAVAQRGRDGITGARPPGEIGFAVLRAGGIVGEHSVMFAAEDEIPTLSHSARDRSMFARGGAPRRAGWCTGNRANTTCRTCWVSARRADAAPCRTSPERSVRRAAAGSRPAPHRAAPPALLHCRGRGRQRGGRRPIGRNRAAGAVTPDPELEEAIGTPLLRRLPKGVELTAAGTGFLRDAGNCWPGCRPAASARSAVPPACWASCGSACCPTTGAAGGGGAAAGAALRRGAARDGTMRLPKPTGAPTPIAKHEVLAPSPARERTGRGWFSKAPRPTKPPV